MTLDAPAAVGLNLSSRPLRRRGEEVGFGEVHVFVERVVENGYVPTPGFAEEAAG